MPLGLQSSRGLTESGESASKFAHMVRGSPSYLQSFGLRASVLYSLLSRGFYSLQFGPLPELFTIWQLPSPMQSDPRGRGEREREEGGIPRQSHSLFIT